VRSGPARIAAEGAISAIIAAEVGKGDEDLSRVGDHVGLEAVASCSGGRQKLGEIFIVGTNPAARDFPGEGALQRVMQCGSRIKNPI
jgi:hypothetical protein